MRRCVGLPFVGVAVISLSRFHSPLRGLLLSRPPPTAFAVGCFCRRSAAELVSVSERRRFAAELLMALGFVFVFLIIFLIIAEANDDAELPSLSIPLSGSPGSFDYAWRIALLIARLRSG
jgi:hypothetical protein